MPLQVYKWKEQSGGTICNQFRRTGMSLDWSREVCSSAECSLSISRSFNWIHCGFWHEPFSTFVSRADWHSGCYLLDAVFHNGCKALKGSDRSIYPASQRWSHLQVKHAPLVLKRSLHLWLPFQFYV